MKIQKNLFILIYIFFLSSFIIIPLTNFNDYNIPNNFILKNGVNKKDFIINSESTNSINLQGTGSKLKGEEYPYNESYKQRLINNDEINWKIPSTYSGQTFWVRIENLTANETLDSQEYADAAIMNEGDGPSGSVSDTYSQDTNSYRVDDGTSPPAEGIDVDFEFDISGISKADVISIDWYVRGRRQFDFSGGQDVQIRIWNDTSSSFTTISSIVTITLNNFQGTINGNDCFASSNPRVILNFFSSNSTDNFVELDHVYIRVYY
ncbi:MAG: hypothetical protein HWN67_14145, partial [Candidatus Helarchaeota archaeon]|nr:hypothetical protein [Candidatus Helarchaeota archaeon]